MKNETLNPQMAPHAAAREQGSQNAAAPHEPNATGTASTTGTESPSAFSVPRHWKAILALYLTGIGMGALDTAIVNPARTVIQETLGVPDQSGVWVFTIYTLAYAAGIPVIGKLADLWGRKPVYLLAIGMFALGSLGCSLSQVTGSFALLLASRVVQAIGGGGIMPVATAAVTTVVPKAKQGMALGLVGMVYGVTSVLGAGAGSLVLAVVGARNWQWVFYINLPIAAAVIGLGIWLLPSQGARDSRRLDLLGVVGLVVMITALLWSFQYLDFTHPGSVTDPNVWGALVLFLVLAPLFWQWETRLEARGGDPIINFKYFATIPMSATLLVGAIAGLLMMTIMFIPQFSELTMNLPHGAGGFPTILVGLASALGAPLSGRLTDRFGPRFVLGIGMGISVLAGVLLVGWAIPFPGAFSTLVSIFIVGLGMGFLMGAPLSYLVLHLVPTADANSGQATLSLVRSIGTTLAPAVLVGFLASGNGADTTNAVSPASSAASATLRADGGLSGFCAELTSAWFSLFHEGPSLGFARMFGCYTLVSLLGLALLLALPSPSQLAPHEPTDI